MKILRKIFVVPFAVGVVYAITAANSIPTIENSSAIDNDINAIISTAEVNECYDQMMNAWFVEFNDLQDKGLSQKEADQLASLEAVKSYKSCD